MNFNKYQIIDLGFVDEEEEFQMTFSYPLNRSKSNNQLEVDFEIAC